MACSVMAEAPVSVVCAAVSLDILVPYASVLREIASMKITEPCAQEEGLVGVMASACAAQSLTLACPTKETWANVSAPQTLRAAVTLPTVL